MLLRFMQINSVPLINKMAKLCFIKCLYNHTFLNNEYELADFILHS